MIRIYPSLLQGEPIEKHDIKRRQTLAEWLADNVNGFDIERDYHPIAVEIEGEYIPAPEWSARHISAESAVDIRIMPQKSVGRAISRAVSSVASAIGSVVNAVVDLVSSLFSFLTPSVPGQNVRAGRQGSSIYDPNAQANQPKLGGVIPEIAGQHKTFPDYLNQPRRYFVNTRTLAVDIFTAIGVGEYLVPQTQIRIGATPLASLGQQVNLSIFGPGQNVTSHQAHRVWYNAPEVGASIGSGAGLRLRSPSDVTLVWAVGSLDVANGSLTRVTGATVPGDWSVGLELSILIPRQIVANPPPAPEDPEDPPLVHAVFTGQFADLGLSNGDEVVITGSALSGSYIVDSVSATELTLDYPDLSPVTSPASGTYIATIDRAGARYRIDSISETGTAPNILRTGITVTKLLPSGDEDTGWLGWSSQRVTNATIRMSDDAVNGDWSGPFLACPPGETVSSIEWDIFAPQGMGRVRDNGSIESRTRTIELQWRAQGASDWTSDARQVGGGTRDQLGWTFTTNFGSPITPEVRVRRTSAEATEVQDLDRLEWMALKSRLSVSPSSYPGITTMALTIEGSDTISGQSENRISCVVTRLLDGSPTRSIADWFRYVALDSGWQPTELDQAELDRLDNTWSARGETFDFVQDDEDTTKEVLRRCLRAGMAELTVQDGLLTPVRDEPRSTFEHLYTPQNMLSDGLRRQVSMIRPDDIDGVDVEYFDRNSWTNETVECRMPGDSGVRAEKIRLEGVTSRVQAWRIGMRERRQQRYRRWIYQFATELDALNSNYLSYCALADDVPGYGQSALIKSVSGNTIELSEPVPADADVMAWRRPDGTLSGPWAITSSAGFSAIVDATELPAVDWKKELPHALFGTTERWSFPVLITSIQPQGFDRVQVQAANYDERIYADDDNTPPA
jgi:hypothetical protein